MQTYPYLLQYDRKFVFKSLVNNLIELERAYKYCCEKEKNER